jgi:putative transcriptional regulator
VTFADSIIQLRSELRISQKELAEQLNISIATVNRWENGRTEPNKMTLFVIRDFCKSKNITFAFNTSKSVERGEQT